MWQKKTKLPLTERMTKLEIYDEQSIRFNSIIRQMNQKIAKIGTSEILNRRENPPSSAVKLPKMELKTFDGNVLKWHEFWKNFEHCVHNQPLVQELQKFSYLKSCLKGPAFVCISNFELREENYGPAIQLLKDRYGHKNVLRKAHLDSLEKLAPVSNSRDVPRLKRLYEEVESHYKALLAVNVMPHEYTATMVPKLLEKLPMDVRIKLNETKDENEDLKIDELAEELRKIVKIREKSGVQLKENVGEIKRFKEKRNYNSDTSGKSLVTGTTLVANDASKKNICAFCLGKQVSSSCTKFAKTKERGEVLQKYNKCFSCLQKEHRIKECRRAKLCSKCTKRKHHESLCDGEHDEKGTSEVCGVMNNKKAQEPSASVAYQTVIVDIQS